MAYSKSIDEVRGFRFFSTFLSVEMAIAFGILFLVNGTFAQARPSDPTVLAVGDNAPELKIDKWLKNGGFNSLEKGKVYLIEIWAVWCAPCTSGFPHLSELQHKYKDKNLRVIGITSDDPYGNTIDQAEKMITQKAAAMDFDVAWVPPSADADGTRGIFLHPWMKQTGTANMPNAFIVDRDGKFAFIGDPYSVDKPLDDIINGKYDLAVLRASYLEGLAAEKIMKEFTTAVKGNDFERAITLGNRILTGFAHVKPNTFLSIGASISTIKVKIDPRLLDLGFKAIKRGIAATNFASSGYFDVLASLHAAKGDFVEAVNSEKHAISLSEGEMRENQIRNLEKYRGQVSN